MPGHTIETFPDVAWPRSSTAGHELACHGWLHEDLAALDADAAARRPGALDRGAHAGRRRHRADAASGRRTGRSARETLGIVESLGFAYDSSLMDDDTHLHRVRRRRRPRRRSGRQPSRAGGSAGRGAHQLGARRLAALRALDGAVGPMSAPSKVLEIWLEELRYAWGEEAAAHAPRPSAGAMRLERASHDLDGVTSTG